MKNRNFVPLLIVLGSIPMSNASCKSKSTTTGGTGGGGGGVTVTSGPGTTATQSTTSGGGSTATGFATATSASSGIGGGMASTTSGVGGAGGATSSATSSATNTATSTASSTSSSSSTTTSSTTTSASTTSASTTSASTTSATSSSSTGGGTCSIGHLVISEVRSRGAAGASDEFIELFNATPAAVTLDSTWKIEGRSDVGATYSSRWTGTGKTIPAWGHFLIAGSAYTEMPIADEALSTGITDATSLRLVQGTANVDAVCYAFSAATMMPFTTDPTYTCEGTPVSNAPHDNTSSATSNVDVSIERKPGGTGGNCTDTNNNASDFMTQMPATPQNSSSPPTP